MGWSPREFWSSTPTELYRAIEGWQESQGTSTEASFAVEPLTRDELLDLMERFPD